MSNIVGNLVIRLAADTGTYESGIRKAQKMTDRRMKAMERRVRKWQRNFGRAMQRVGRIAKSGALAITGLAAAFATLTTRTLTAVANLGDMANAIGISVTDLTRLQYAADMTGSSANQLANGLTVLQKRVGEGFQKGSGPTVDAFNALGLSIEDIAEMDPAEQFMTIANAMQDLDSQSARNAVTAQLFSRANQGLVNTLTAGTEAIRDLSDESDRLGNSLSENEVTMAAKAADAIQQLKTQISSLWQRLVIKLSPAITKLTEKVVEWLDSFDASKLNPFFFNVTKKFNELWKTMRPVIIAWTAFEGGVLGGRLTKTPMGAASGAVVGTGLGLASTYDITKRLEAADPLGRIEKAENRIASINRGITAAYKNNDMERVQELAGRAKEQQQIIREAHKQLDENQGLLGLLIDPGNLPPLPQLGSGGGNSGDGGTNAAQAAAEAQADAAAARAAERRQYELDGLTSSLQTQEERIIDSYAKRQGIITKYHEYGSEEYRKWTERNMEQLEQQLEHARQTYDAMALDTERYAKDGADALTTFLINPSKQGFDDLLQAWQATLNQMIHDIISSNILQIGKTLGGRLLSSVASAFSGGMTAGEAAVMKEASIDATSIAVKGTLLPKLEFASGGLVKGPGTATSDSIPAWLSDGEAVLNARAVKALGPGFIHRANNAPGLARGGVVGSAGVRGGGTVVNVYNQSGGGRVETKRRSGDGGRGEIIDVFLKAVAGDIRNHGEVGRAVLQSTTASMRLRG